mgnify:CR=1 FL=1|tara:strand:- start:196 stop:486 length:291 start_codon:yes stop_codon:yes gene_type:complete
MVKHIVMFKLFEKNSDNINKAILALEGMRGKIDVLKNLEVGVDYKNSECSYDIVLTTEFTNKEGLEIYATHPLHIPVKKLLFSLCSHTTVVDYEYF